MRNSASRQTQPATMKTKAYVYGVEPLNGFDAWALFKASADGDVDKARALLRRDPRLVNAQYWYQFPIHFAVRQGHDEIVDLLLRHGADPGQSRFTYNSWDKLLHVARQRGRLRIEQLLQKAMKRRFHYSTDFHLLRDAIISRDSRKISAVLRRRPDLLDASDELGNNGLHWAVLTRQLPWIRKFAELGTPIDARRADGSTPILLAVSEASDYWYRGSRDASHPSLRNTWVLVGNLLAHGAKYTVSVASAVGDFEQVVKLLEREPGLANRLNTARVSPLSYAAREGYAHIAERLLECGADPNQPEDLAPRGRPLFEACAGNHIELAELLLNRGADPNAGVDSCGCCLSIVRVHFPKSYRPLQDLLRRHGAHTPPYDMSVAEMKQALLTGHQVIRDEEFLGCLLEKKNTTLLDLLLDVDPQVTDRMHVHAGVIYPRSAKLVRQLLDRGLDPRRPDWLGKTYLHACAENGDLAIARLFLEAGANIDAKDLEFGGTPLATAVRCYPIGESAHRAQRQTRFIRYLLQHGAAVAMPDDEPWSSPIWWARKLGLAQIESMLTKQQTASD